MVNESSTRVNESTVSVLLWQMLYLSPNPGCLALKHWE